MQSRVRPAAGAADRGVVERRHAVDDDAPARSASPATGSNYLIADRLGITAELIPHLTAGGTAIHYPSGQRGLYVYGRTGAAALVPNAFRALVVT